jgi:methionine-rich copper-binding protein CopC
MKILICMLMAVLVACGAAPTPDTTAPSTPQGLKATARNAAVNLEWTANTDADLEHYVLLWGSGAAAQNAKEVIAKTQTSFELKGLTNGTAYYFKLEASDTAGNTSSGSSLLSATPNTADRTAPSISSSVPELNATGVVLNTQIQLTFSKAMNTGSVTTSSGDLTLGAATWNAAQTTVSFVTPPLQNDQTYTILISGKDTTGNNLSGITSLQFSSLAAAPTVTGGTPTNNAQNVASNSKISLRFSKPMSKIGVEMAFSSNPAIECNWLWTDNDKTATCTPDSNLQLQTQYNIAISRLAKSKTGEALENPFALNFTTVPDKVKPALIGFAPSDNQTNAPINSAIVLNFSKAMNRASVENAFQSQPAIVCNWTWTTDSSVSCQPSSTLQGSSHYVITLASSASDLVGNTLQTAYGFRFGTQNTPPVIALISPETGKLEPLTRIELTFNEAMDKTATQNAFEVFTIDIFATKTIVPGSIAWSFDGTQMTFTPNAAYPGFPFIFWQLGATAKDASGLAIASENSGSFRYVE